MSTLSSLSFLYFCLSSRSSWYSILLTSSFSALLFLVSALLAISFFQQGSGFNYQFFEHFTFDSLYIAVAGFKTEVALFFASALVAIVVPIALLQRTKLREQRRNSLLAILLSLLLCYPLWDVASFLLADGVGQGYPQRPSSETENANLPASQSKNIILMSDIFSRSDFPAYARNIQSAKTSLIAHAGGALQKNTYTNSLEALESNKPYFDLFEMDLIFTSDNELVCLHDWDVNFERLFNRKVTSPLTLDEFRLLVADLQITPCDLSSLMDWLSENPSKYVVTDIKERNLKALEQITNRYPELMHQIIPQVYQWGEYSQVTELGYDKIIFTLYALRNLSIPRLLQDISENEYFAVTFPRSMADDLGELLASRGVRTYVHTVNKMQEANALKEIGVWGVYTDFLRD
jgi:glycerophosphoryl diester phosphodiesterase